MLRADPRREWHWPAGSRLTTHEPGIGVVTGPNITPDRETGIGNLTAAQIVDELRNGKRPDGTLIGPPMPIPVYQKLSDGDAAAIAAYLLSVRPVQRSVARNQYEIPLPPNYGPPLTHVDEPSRGDKVAYGAYLATFAHCVLCHTPPTGRPFDMSRAFAGGRDLPDFGKSGAIVLSRNITSDPDHGIGKWTNAQIKRAIVLGVRPDGTRLAVTMPFAWYKRITPADLDAIVALCARSRQRDNRVSEQPSSTPLGGKTVSRQMYSARKGPVGQSFFLQHRVRTNFQSPRLLRWRSRL